MSSTAAQHDDPTARTSADAGRLRAALAAFGATLRDPSLRRTALAFGLAVASDWGFRVAIAVVAFAHGGAVAVGVVVTICLLPAALLAPFGAVLADRIARDRILVVVGLTVALTTAAAALAVSAGVSELVVYALAVVATVQFTLVRPTHCALLPSLCRTPQQLTNATVVRGLMDSLATLVGPALAGVALAIGGPAAAIAAVAAGAALSALLMLGVRSERPAVACGRPAPRRRVGREVLDGYRALRAHRDVRIVVAIALAQTFTRGCLGVLVVVLAIDVLGRDDAAVGMLTSMIGAGALAGSLAAGLLSRSRAIARWEGIGSALYGLPLVAIALLPQEPAIVACLVALGMGNALVDVGLFTLPARIVSDELLGRVFGIFESLGALTVALGSLAAPLAVQLLGIQGALLAIGATAPLCVLAAWTQLSRIDREVVARDDEIALLRHVAMFRPLPLPAIERLAARVRPVAVPAGGAVFEHGGDGDGFYVVASGAAEVHRDGHLLRVLGPGDGFGEIALLRECSRTATVRASEDLRLDVIVRDDFLAAVSGYSPAAREADATVELFLREDAGMLRNVGALA